MRVNTITNHLRGGASDLRGSQKSPPSPRRAGRLKKMGLGPNPSTESTAAYNSHTVSTWREPCPKKHKDRAVHECISYSCLSDGAWFLLKSQRIDLRFTHARSRRTDLLKDR